MRYEVLVTYSCLADANDPANLIVTIVNEITKFFPEGFSLRIRPLEFLSGIVFEAREVNRG
jgi:hypothetical protein